MNRKKYLKPRAEVIHVMQQQQLLQASGTTGNDTPTGDIDVPPVFLVDELSPELAL